MKDKTSRKQAQDFPRHSRRYTRYERHLQRSKYRKLYARVNDFGRLSLLENLRAFESIKNICQK